MKKRRKCLHCKKFFTPDARNQKRARYCSATPCRQASKAASQQRWCAKPENHDYFKGPYHVARVQAWRRAHPGYAKKPVTVALALQDRLTPQAIESSDKNALFVLPKKTPLQDHYPTQVLVLTGLLAHLSGSTLQEDIAALQQRLIRLGQAVSAAVVLPSPPF